jgi:hypothetical protein
MKEVDPFPNLSNCDDAQVQQSSSVDAIQAATECAGRAFISSEMTLVSSRYPAGRTTI